MIRKAIATVLLSLSFITMSVAPATAVTVYYSWCYTTKYPDGWWEKRCWHDYNWFEERFMAKKDGYYIVSYGKWK